MELSKVQQEAVDFYEGCCDVIAGAGSGKTAVLVNRIINLIERYDVAPNNILAITFSKRAKENMKNRLRKMTPCAEDINIETFHSFGYRIIRKFSGLDYEILDADWKIVKIISEIFDSELNKQNIGQDEIKTVLNYISKRKNCLTEPNTELDLIYERVFQKYEEYKEKQNLLDFDDMLSKCYNILLNNEGALEYCQESFRFILADEMQDTNAVQYLIIKLIGERYKNVFIVGDGLQAIYAFRGSDNRYIMEFDKDWPNTKIIHLNKNYRSSEDIVAVANHFAKCIPESKHPHYIESVADKKKFMAPNYMRCKTGFEEAQAIADQIEKYVSEGYGYKEIAILTRTNAMLQYFETELYNHKIPYTVVDGASFVDRKEIKTILCYLKLISDSNNDQAFEVIYNIPNRFLGKSFINDVKEKAKRLHVSMYDAMKEVVKLQWKYKGAQDIYRFVEKMRKSRYRNIGEMIKDLRKNLDIDSYITDYKDESDNDRIENLNALQEMAGRHKSIKNFITYVTEFSKNRSKTINSVQLMTIHKSKGLEFPIVFIAGVNQGMLPHEKNENVDEEKRLMYVAITRAEKMLHISSTEQYNGKEYQESDFIAFLFG